MYKSPMANLASLHAVLGFITVVFFTFQFVMGLFFFAICKNGAWRAKFIAAHRGLGTMLGGFTAASIVTGACSPAPAPLPRPDLTAARLPPGILDVQETGVLQAGARTHTVAAPPAAAYASSGELVAPRR